jgi:hypothetical protein
MGFHQIKKLLPSKGKNYQDKEKTYRMGKMLPVINWKKD